MKKQNLTLHTDAVTDAAIIEQALYDILMEYDVHSRSGPRFIRISIIGDISIIIKMLNMFPQEAESYILYVYLSSSKYKQYIFSSAIQCNIEQPSMEMQLKEAIKIITQTVIQLMTMYGYRTEHFKIIHNLDDEGIPPCVYSPINIPKEYTDVQNKITFIIDTLTTDMDIYNDHAMIELYYHINKGTEYEVNLKWSVYIQYSEIFYTDNYSVRFVKGEDSSAKYAMTVNDFVDYLYGILIYLYRIASYTVEGETGTVVAYLMNSESMEHM